MQEKSSKEIDRMNDWAEILLEIRRQELGEHREGYHLGKPNPHSVGYVLDDSEL